jgi:hypothetical protein
MSEDPLEPEFLATLTRIENGMTSLVAGVFVLTGKIDGQASAQTQLRVALMRWMEKLSNENGHRS